MTDPPTVSSDDWMPIIQIPMPKEQFDQLPRNAAYRYDYIEGCAHLTPRPRYYHAQLDFESIHFSHTSDVEIRPLREHDWEPLATLFTHAFNRQQPFAGMPEDRRVNAARASLAQVRRDGDGPLIENASFVALGEDNTLIGAVLVTLVPLGDPSDWNTYCWLYPPPANCIEERFGQPHLTWIFVHPDRAGRGIGTALLEEAVEALRDMGYDWMLSTFLSGNDASMLWHWRVGFRLVSYPDSLRRYLLS